MWTISSFSAEQTQGFIDVYYATASAVMSMQGPLTPKELIKSAREQLDRAEILGEVAAGRKATSDTTFMNALEQLERYRMIRAGSGGVGQRGALRERGRLSRISRP